MDGFTFLLFIVGFGLLLLAYAPVSWVVDRFWGPER